ncbi:hypothetical protein LFL96_36750 (plasmid) [Paraburkholderia sp. D15]|uniref:hypothetical protein n=1 Tax=Paraburkholderia sp. D15 TaxID=2880218 RepID=UPI00247AECAA|nr:hypothetical protein [Paraburkholderia sp. D15]WGS55028.1 hypothetical protein LFL96_36750 [Paraburkholderia sp. D15]
MQYLPEQTIDAERERWASNFTVAMRSLRKRGFTVVQDPLASQQSNDLQLRQSHDAACVLLGLPATPENVGHQVVQALGRELLENGAMALQQLNARGHI